MSFRIKFKPRKYTIKANNLNHVYDQILDKLPALACFTYGSRAMVLNFLECTIIVMKHYMFIV